MIKKLKDWIKTGNKCSKCPYYSSYYDSFTCDGGEFCHCDNTDKWGNIKICYYPIFVRHILALRMQILQKIWDRRAEKAYLKEEKERIALGMDEEEYWDYKNNDLVH